MKKKYNLALIPRNQNKRDEAIKFSQKFSGIADKYLLSEKSLPHVTLYQFEVDESEIDTVWKKVCKACEEKPLHLEFKDVSCLTFDKQVYWIFLVPNKGDVLHKMHSQIADILKLPTKKTFDPHMTLVSTKNTEYKKEVDALLKSYTPISDDFVLSLGKSDEVGQFTEIVYPHRTPTKRDLN